MRITSSTNQSIDNIGYTAQSYNTSYPPPLLPQAHSLSDVSFPKQYTSATQTHCFVLISSRVSQNKLSQIKRDKILV